MNWHVESINESEQRLSTDIERGLTTDEAEKRLHHCGGNIVGEQPHKTFMQRVGYQLSAFLVIILLAAACVSFVVAINSTGGNMIEPLVVSALTLIAAVCLAVVEQRTEDMRVKLISSTETECRVKRDGRIKTIPTSVLVPGDIMYIETGDLVPADGRLLSAVELCCDETAVDGEAHSMLKDALSEPDITAQLAERSNLIYAGCPVISGHGTAIVTDTGASTELGKRAGLLDTGDRRNTPLKAQLGVLGKNLALAGLIVIFIVFIVGFANRHPNDMKAIEVFMSAMALGVAAIPECIPTVFSVLRIKGALFMSEQGAVAANPDTLEKLSSVSVICTDKSCMVEKKRMSVRRLWTPSGRLCAPSRRGLDEGSLRLLEYAALCCDSTKEQTGLSASGDSAIIACLLSCGIKKRNLDAKYPRAAVYPFDTEKRLMVTVHSVGDTLVAMIKGSPERVLPMCAGYSDSGEHSDTVRKALAICERLGGDAMQVLAVACVELEQLPENADWLNEADSLSFIGVLGLSNHPDEETKLTAAGCEQAGIRIVMITGDQPSTAKAVAQEAGILRTGEEMLTSQQLAAMSEKELENNLRKYSVFASMTTDDKLRIVKAWKQSGETVAVTGSSIEDVQALREGDIGCSLGQKGAEVAKGTADLTITDDSLATVFNAIRAGRCAYDNLRAAIQYILTTSLTLMATVLIATVATGITPMLPTHFLMLFPLAILFPAIGFASEPPQEDIMSSLPKRAERYLVSSRVIFDTVIYSAGLTAIGLTAYFIGRAGSMEAARTMTFAALTLSMLSHALSVRTRELCYKPTFLANTDLLLTIFICAAITLLLLFVPPDILFLNKLTFGQWSVVATLSAAPFVGGEVLKFIRRAVGGHIIIGFED